MLLKRNLLLMFALRNPHIFYVILISRSMKIRVRYLLESCRKVAMQSTITTYYLKHKNKEKHESCHLTISSSHRHEKAYNSSWLWDVAILKYRVRDTSIFESFKKETCHVTYPFPYSQQYSFTTNFVTNSAVTRNISTKTTM